MDLRAIVLRFLKFGVVGASGVVVNLGVYVALTRLLGLGESLLTQVIAYGMSVEISIFTNYLLNDLWTFRDRRAGASWPKRLWLFHLVSLVGFAINWGIFAGLNLLLAHTGGTMVGHLVVLGRDVGNVDDLLAACIGIGAAMFWNFFGNLLWTWTAEKDLEDAG
ncbi:MAG: GtrA family protein [Pseudomonadota bacterium]